MVIIKEKVSFSVIFYDRKFSRDSTSGIGVWDKTNAVFREKRRPSDFKKGHPSAAVRSVGAWMISDR